MLIELQNHKAHIFTSKPYDQSKESIVFIPGAGMDHRIVSMFKFGKINDIYNILAIDLPGHGYTTGPLFDNVSDHSQFCIEVIDKLKINEPIIIGHSFGSLIALDLSTKNKNKQTICMNVAYPFSVGDILLDHAKGNLDQAVDFLMKYGVYKFPNIDIKTKGFGTMGSGFYGRSKGEIKSPYGTKNIESDPEKEIKLYPLKRLFNQTEKEISSFDLKICNAFRLKNSQIAQLKDIKYIFGEKDKLARYNPENNLFKNIDSDKDIFILKQTGHFPYFEDPKQLLRVLEEILN